MAAILIPRMQKLAMIAADEASALEAQNRLARVGLDQVVGYSLADEAGWRKAGMELGSIAIRRCEEVRRELEEGVAHQLIDVRSRAEWLRGHLPGAIFMPLLDLDPRKPAPRDSNPAGLVYCHEGYRATTAASMLIRGGGSEVGILVDGVEGWLALGLPLERQEG